MGLGLGLGLGFGGRGGRGEERARARVTPPPMPPPKNGTQPMLALLTEWLECWLQHVASSPPSMLQAQPACASPALRTCRRGGAVCSPAVFVWAQRCCSSAPPPPASLGRPWQTARIGCRRNTRAPQLPPSFSILAFFSSAAAAAPPSALPSLPPFRAPPFPPLPPPSPRPRPAPPPSPRPPPRQASPRPPPPVRPPPRSPRPPAPAPRPARPRPSGRPRAAPHPLAPHPPGLPLASALPLAADAYVLSCVKEQHTVARSRSNLNLTFEENNPRDPRSATWLSTKPIERLCPRTLISPSSPPPPAAAFALLAATLHLPGCPFSWQTAIRVGGVTR